jgi:hypothetical protein
MRCRLHADGGRPVFIGDADGDLPHAAAEVRALAAAHHVPARLGAAATRAAVLASRDTAWLHLAVHGEVGPEGGALSLRDGPLAAASVLREHLAPGVVVLAGCSTATGADVESWTGLPSAFLAAGSRFVIATTRSVGDDAAAAPAPTLRPGAVRRRRSLTGPMVHVDHVRFRSPLDRAGAGSAAQALGVRPDDRARPVR